MLRNQEKEAMIAPIGATVKLGNVLRSQSVLAITMNL